MEDHENTDGDVATMYCCGDVKSTAVHHSRSATSDDLYQKPLCAIVELLLKLNKARLTSKRSDLADFTVLSEEQFHNPDNTLLVIISPHLCAFLPIIATK